MTVTETAAAQNTQQSAAPTETKPTETPAAQNTTQANGQTQSSTPVETKPSETKPVEAQTYDLKVSEGSLLDQASIESIKAFAKSKGLSNEMAQEFLNRENEAVKSYLTAQAQKHETKRNSWVEEVKADPEIGGDKFKENIELAHRVIKKFGNEKFIQELEQTGLGNYAPLVKVFHKIGQAMREDQLVVSSQSVPQQKSIEQIFYPNMMKGN